eukprot:1645058-Prymnesium_polylepis.1
MFISSFVFFRINFGVLLHDWYLLCGSGAGLFNSFGSGKMYMGADWNRNPLPTVDEAWSGAHANAQQRSERCVLRSRARL